MFRSVADFLKVTGPKPSKAELALIEACRNGEGHTVNDGTLPPDGTPDPDIIVRASLLRLLIMGGTPECGLHESGVWLEGAVIIGELDLRSVVGQGRVALESCRFQTEPDLCQSSLEQFSLDDSFLPGLLASHVRIESSLFLRRITSTATVDVNHAEIGGQLNLAGANIHGSGGKALNAQGAKIKGSVFLSSMYLDDDIQPFNAKGLVDLMRVEIGGQLAFEGATLDGGRGKALNAQGAKVKDGFFFRKLGSVTGQVDLNTASVSGLADDAQTWRMCQDGLNLTDFSYDRINGSGIAPKTFAGRKDWLAKGAIVNGEFSPQPYTQLAKVFRAAGDMGEARKVLMERDRLLGVEARKANLNALAAARAGASWDVGNAWLRLHLAGGWDWLTRQVIGYGHAPQRALWVALGLIGAGAVLFFLAWQAGVMVPNSAVILTSDDWLKAMADPALRPPHAWIGLPSATHYETFYSLPYALDVFLPLVSIGQENAWAATTDIGFGKVIRWFTFAYQIAGWVVTSLGIAAITGFVQRGSPD